MQFVYLGGLQRPASLDSASPAAVAGSELLCSSSPDVIWDEDSGSGRDAEGSLWAERLVWGQVRVPAALQPPLSPCASSPGCSPNLRVPRVSPGWWDAGAELVGWMLGVPSQRCSRSIPCMSSSPLSQQKAVSPRPSWHVTRAWTGLSHLLQAERLG